MNDKTTTTVRGEVGLEQQVSVADTYRVNPARDSIQTLPQFVVCRNHQHHHHTNTTTTPTIETNQSDLAP